MTENIRSTLANLNCDKEESMKQDDHKGNLLSERIDSLEKMIKAIIKT